MKTTVVVFEKGKSPRILINPEPGEYESGSSVLNPDMSKLAGIPLENWSKSGNTIVADHPQGGRAIALNNHIPETIELGITKVSLDEFQQLKKKMYFLLGFNCSLILIALTILWMFIK